jgi:hypothetical protein
MSSISRYSVSKYLFCAVYQTDFKYRYIFQGFVVLSGGKSFDKWSYEYFVLKTNGEKTALVHELFYSIFLPLPYSCTVI